MHVIFVVYIFVAVAAQAYSFDICSLIETVVEGSILCACWTYYYCFRLC